VRAPIRGFPASTEPPPFRIAFMPPLARTVSSKTSRTLAGAFETTAPFAGTVPSSLAWADAVAGNARAARRANTSATRRDTSYQR
jgi:hypothetical protein